MIVSNVMQNIVEIEDYETHIFFLSLKILKLSFFTSGYMEALNDKAV